MADSHTIVTILTPSGRGAVASVSVEGPRATQLVDHCFIAAAGKRLDEIPQRRIAFGRWKTTHDQGEELVVSRLDENRVEIHCHGGVAAVEAIVASLVAAGAERRSPAAWAEAHECDAIAAEARLALAEAKTERAALHLLDQYQGALRREVNAILAQLEQQNRDAVGRLQQLTQRSRAGLHLTKPWRIAIIGPPNVGKSSLMNALLGYSRSIVFDQPGTTRDLVTAETAFEGWPVQLTDTAGLRQTDDAVESAGVALAWQASQQADLLLRVSDTTEFQNDASSQVNSQLPEIAVLNKIDLRSDLDRLLWPGVKVSAQTGQGLGELIRAILHSLLGVPPQRGAAIPFTFRQAEVVAEARTSAEQSDFAHAKELLSGLLG